MAVARYWRLCGMAARTQSTLQLCALHLYAGAERVCAGAALSSSLNPSVGSVASLQDSDTATACTFGAAQLRSGGLHILWDFGGAPVDVDALRIGAGDDVGRFLAAALLQSSTDGVLWSDALQVGAATWPGARALTPVLPFVAAPAEKWAESFDVGIPPGFATTLTDSATLGATWESATESVLLDSIGYNAVWLLSGYTPDTHAGLEIDYEALEDYGNNRMVGVSFHGSGPVDQLLLLHNTNTAIHFSSGGAWSIGLAVNRGSAPFSIPTGRHTLRVTSRPVGGLQEYTIALGAAKATFVVTEAMARSCGIFVRSQKLRLFGLRALGAPSGSAFGDAPMRTDFLRALVAASAPVPASTTAVLHGAAVACDVEHGGSGVVQGTVERDADPVDLPMRRRVRLFDERSGLLVRETWSDATTGAYSFDKLNAARTYTVVAYDHEHHYRAVVADNMTPKVAP